MADDTAFEDNSSGGGGYNVGNSSGVQTTVYLDQTGNLGGSTSIKSGDATGVRGRTVVVEASVFPGYVFKGWQVSTRAVSLQRYADVVNNAFSNVIDACKDTRKSNTTLYTDGYRLYLDVSGNSEAPTGFWYNGNGSYVEYSTRGSIATNVCPPPVNTGGGGGGGNTDRMADQD